MASCARRAPEGRPQFDATAHPDRAGACRGRSRERRGAPSRSLRSRQGRRIRLNDAHGLRARQVNGPSEQVDPAPANVGRHDEPSIAHGSSNRGRFSSGDAQASRTRSPPRASTSPATSCDASSCTTNRPVFARGVRSGLPARTTNASRANRQASSSTPCRREPVSAPGRRCAGGWRESSDGAGWLLNRSHASTASNPYRSSQRAASQRGCDNVTDR